MARPKEFDEDEVLDQALALFRARGYKHTSCSDLVTKLGISRQSLYDTYGDKSALYQTALKRYSDRGLDQVRRRFDGARPIRPALREFFEATISANCDCGQGCFMVNSMVELAPHDAATRALAQRHAREFESLLASALSAAQRRGEIPPQKDPVALGRFLYHAILGLSVAARALGEHESLRQSARLALQALD